MYQVKMLLNFAGNEVCQKDGISIQWTGFPTKYTQTATNIVDFDMEMEGMASEGDKWPFGFEIVGFEVIPCSVKHDPANIRELKSYDNIATMNCPVELEKSQIVRENESKCFN